MGGVLVVELLVPERATLVTDADGATTAGATVLKSGAFEGKTGHEVSGRAEIVERDGTATSGSWTTSRHRARTCSST